MASTVDVPSAVVAASVIAIFEVPTLVVSNSTVVVFEMASELVVRMFMLLVSTDWLVVAV